MIYLENSAFFSIANNIFLLYLYNDLQKKKKIKFNNLKIEKRKFYPSKSPNDVKRYFFRHVLIGCYFFQCSGC